MLRAGATNAAEAGEYVDERIKPGGFCGGINAEFRRRNGSQKGCLCGAMNIVPYLIHSEGRLGALGFEALASHLDSGL